MHPVCALCLVLYKTGVCCYKADFQFPQHHAGRSTARLPAEKQPKLTVKVH